MAAFTSNTAREAFATKMSTAQASSPTATAHPKFKEENKEVKKKKQTLFAHSASAAFFASRPTETKSITATLFDAPKASPTSAMPKATYSATKRYINIPEGKIGRLEKRENNELSLYVEDFSSATVIALISHRRISLLHFGSIYSNTPSHITTEHILAELEWVNGDADDFHKMIIQPPLGNDYPAAFIELGSSITSQFIQHNHNSAIYAFSINWKKDNGAEVIFGEASEIERHPLEKALMRYHKQGRRSATLRKASDFNPLIFTGNTWQIDYSLPTHNLSAEASAFLQSVRENKRSGFASNTDAVTSSPETKATPTPSHPSPWEELKKVLAKKRKCKNKKDNNKVKAKLRQIAPRLMFDRNAIITTGFSLEEALNQAKKLEVSHTKVLSLAALIDQLEKALATVTSTTNSTSPSSPLAMPHITEDGKEEKRETKIERTSTHFAIDHKANKTKHDLKNSSMLDKPYQFNSFTIRRKNAAEQKPATILGFTDHGQKAHPRFDKACQLICEGKLEAAIKALRDILPTIAKNKPIYVLTLYHMGLCFRMLGDADNVQKYLDPAIDLLQRTDFKIKYFNPAKKAKLLADCYVEKATSLKLLNQWGKAEHFYRKAIEIFEDCYQAYHALGLLKVQQGNLSEAYNLYNQAIEKHDRCSIAYADLGRLLAKMEQPEEAIRMFDKAIHFGPAMAQYYSDRGDIKRELGLLKEAREDFERAIRLDAHLTAGHNNLAICDFLSGYPRKAITALEKLRTNDPTNRMILLNLSSAYIVNEDYQEATSIVLRLLHIDPTHISGWLNLASAYMLSGNSEKEKGLIALENAMKLSEGIGNRTLHLIEHTLLARVLTGLKCYEEAIHVYEGALQYCASDQENAELYFHLGNLHFDNRNYAKALEYYKRAHAFIRSPIIEQYIKEAQEAIEDPEIFAPESRDLQDRLLSPEKFEEKREKLAEELQAATHRSALPKASAFKNLRYKEGLPFHGLVLADDTSAPKTPKIRKLFLNAEDGYWYQRSCHRYAAYSKDKKASSDKIYNFIVTQNAEGMIEIIYGRVGHFYLSKNRSVIFAGEIWFREGNILGWNNASGHFKPDASLASRVSTICPLPLNKFISLDAFKARLSELYQRCRDPKRIAEVAEGSLGCRGTVKSMRHHYM